MSWSTVPLLAVVSSQKKLFAGILAELNEVTILPVVVDVVVVPLVTTSVPVALLSLAFLTVHVTEGVALPIRTQASLVIVRASSVKNIDISSAFVGALIVRALLQFTPRFVLAVAAVLHPVHPSATATSVHDGA